MRAIPLYNMATSAYDWSNAWSDKELAALDDIKQTVIESSSLHYLDYNKILIFQLRLGLPCSIRSEKIKSSSLLPSWDANLLMQLSSGTPTRKNAILNTLE